MQENKKTDETVNEKTDGENKPLSEQEAEESNEKQEDSQKEE